MGRDLGDHCSGCGLPLHPSTCSPSPGFSGPVFPECHSHPQSCPVHLIPGLCWIWWLTLASFFQGLLDFSPSRLPSQFPRSFCFPSSKSVLTSDPWWPLLYLPHCPGCWSGILGRSGDKLTYLSASSLYSALGRLPAAGLRKAGNLSVCLWLCLHPEAQGKSLMKS